MGVWSRGLMLKAATKQVIVMRKDLNMRKGKMVAQGSHASLGAWLLINDALRECEQGLCNPIPDDRYPSSVYEAASVWINGTFTKVCVSVNSENELLSIYAAANEAGLPVKLITDAGHTECPRARVLRSDRHGRGYRSDHREVSVDVMSRQTRTIRKSRR